MERNNINNEDEDIVIQGSALHEHLSKLGYTDFESMSMPKRVHLEEKHFFDIDIRNITNKTYVKIFSFYSWLTQEKSISRKQLNIILNAETLLNDHSAMINSFLNTSNNNSKMIALQELIISGVILISSAYVPLCNNKLLLTLLVSSTICGTSYMKHLRFCAHRDLKNVISLQNEIFIMCKKSLQILRHDYKIKICFEKCSQQFFHFLGEKLYYLQPLTETLIKIMQNISYVYYQCSLSIAKLLPSDVLNDDLFTKFENNSFEVFGEISYQTLKKLYHIYVLIQSEMLYLLAIAYNSNTWIDSCKRIPETKLAHIIHVLTKRLTIYKHKLSEVFNAYNSCKTEPIQYKARGTATWHNPTIQLDLASHKLQLAYNQVFTIFQDIDDCVTRETVIDNEAANMLMQRLDKAFKEIDIAKTIAEFVILLMAKSRIHDLRNSQGVTNNVIINQNSDMSKIIDSDPEIFDEVFEEYITEEHLKSLHEEIDEYSLEQYKLDKLLAKSFMIELKEALIDKQKSMSERESKALQRIYKNVSKNPILCAESNINRNDSCFIPVPPPMPSYYIWSTSTNNIDSNNLDYKKISPCNIESDSLSIKRNLGEVSEKTNIIETLENEKISNMPFIEDCLEKNGERFISAPQILLETRATQYAVKLPPIFLQEEVFIGSGENSEDEIIEDAIVNDRNEKNENESPQSQNDTLD